MTSPLRIIRLKGQEIVPFISELAALRIKIFHDYPYLYEGDLEYEKKYLKTYTDCPEVILVLVFDQDRIVGASTALPLKFETPNVIEPFRQHIYNINSIFCFGESILLPEYRGQQIGKQFFAERENAAREQGYKIATFFEVIRSPDDPRRPSYWHPLNSFWEKLGYEKHSELNSSYSWKEIGETEESPKPITFWLKQL
jgi:GNAT superfamily N-acetyltransferase